MYAITCNDLQYEQILPQYNSLMTSKIESFDIDKEFLFYNIFNTYKNFFSPVRSDSSSSILPLSEVISPLTYETINESLSIMEDIKHLENNWDGYGAIKIKEKCYNNSKYFLKSINYLPVSDIYPNPNGTISFEWETKIGIAHVEIGNLYYSFFIEYNDDEFYEKDGNTSDIDEIIPTLEKFFTI